MADPIISDSVVATGPRRSRLEPLPLGAITATGWLGERLAYQVRGMAAHLDEHWPSIRDSSWIGGSEDGWERGPYWLDAVVPLAALTGDQELGAKVRRWVDHILERQEASGWMGPHHGDMEGTSDDRSDLDVWPRMPLLKALLQYHSAFGDPRIVPAVHRLALAIGTVLESHPLHAWGHYRAADLIDSLHELHGLTGDDRMLDIAATVERQGYDWRVFADEMPREKVTEAAIARWREKAHRLLASETMISHGVNVAMGLKWMASIWRNGAGGDPIGDLRRMLDALDRGHGQPTGLFSCDEHLAGTHPSQGTETCTVVEAMFSLESSIEAWGIEEDLVDRLERIAFNALPAAATALDDAHQYDQQANQIACVVVDDPLYSSNGPDSNTFGLEPNFGCCTANRHQGWPKFVSRLWFRDRTDGGLVAASYAPAVIRDARDDGVLTVDVSGGYPFGEQVTLRVAADRPLRRPLHLRIPGWATGASVSVDGRIVERPAAGTVARVDRAWSADPVEIVLTLPAAVVVCGNGPVTVTSGPLLFVLPVDERWVQLADHGWMRDQQVLAEGPWACGLVLEGLDGSSRARLSPSDPAADPFTPQGALVGVPARVRAVPDWGVERGAAAVPPSPARASGPADAVTLLPYGAARLRVTVLPAVEDAPASVAVGAASVDS